MCIMASVGAGGCVSVCCEGQSDTHAFSDLQFLWEPSPGSVYGAIYFPGVLLWVSCVKVSIYYSLGQPCNH